MSFERRRGREGPAIRRGDEKAGRVLEDGPVEGKETRGRASRRQEAGRRPR